MNFGDFKDGKAQQPLPPSLAANEADLGRFMELCNKTCARVLELVALGLGVSILTFLFSYHCYPFTAIIRGKMINAWFLCISQTTRVPETTLCYLSSFSTLADIDSFMM